MAAASRHTALLLAACAAAARAQAVPYTLQLSGACDSQFRINGLQYDLQGRVANGSPYYKARGQKEYLYWDPDCTGGGDGSPRWILDTDAPMLDRYSDLDGDKACEYRARFNSLDSQRPPFTGIWKMRCAEGWVDQFLALLELPGAQPGAMTSTSTTVTGSDGALPGAAPTSSAPWRTGAIETFSAPISARPDASFTGLGPMQEPKAYNVTSGSEAMVFGGACEAKRFLNGLRFELLGNSATGYPAYRSRNSSTDNPYYLYFDPSCDGTFLEAPRWVLGLGRPDLTRDRDLDGDGACVFEARHNVTSYVVNKAAGPPAVAQWDMLCASQWQRVNVTLNRTGGGTVGDSFYVSGACPDKSFFNGVRFLRQGVTAGGSPYYKAVTMEQYVYFDVACDGNPLSSPPRWVMDANMPDLSRAFDLDKDGVCDYHARVLSSDPSQPPAAATWKMFCGGAWKDVNVTLSAKPPTQGPLVIQVNGAELRTPSILGLALLVLLSGLLHQ